MACITFPAGASLAGGVECEAQVSALHSIDRVLQASAFGRKRHQLHRPVMARRAGIDQAFLAQLPHRPMQGLLGYFEAIGDVANCNVASLRNDEQDPVVNAAMPGEFRVVQVGQRPKCDMKEPEVGIEVVR
ncbi:hypothetical protein [Noviherbaspirillum sp. L7-7A]|uniref:hypothetical protein n=1 Tax=Noviherbaspirillum sp. L7-7A TaxID=2850560 RepID=UPI002012A05E|nr:hypothetical protein [Noviherbaspirillum sp. L7-7A]